MKKLLVFALVLAMVFAVPTAVLADTFVGSPSSVAAPKLGEAKSSNANWDGEIIVTAFQDKASLSAEAQKEMDAAYDSVKNATSVTKLNSGVEALAKALNVDVKTLAVSTLFDVSSTKAEYGTVTITLTSDAFKNFVALLHFNGTAWEVVEGAKVEGTTLTFSVDDLSPFAVVVGDAKSTTSPATGDGVPAGLIALTVLFGCAGVCFLAKSKKENA